MNVTMTDAERAAWKRYSKDNWLVRIVKNGMSAFVAIPKTRKAETTDINLPHDGPKFKVAELHGMTISIGDA